MNSVLPSKALTAKKKENVTTEILAGLCDQAEMGRNEGQRKQQGMAPWWKGFKQKSVFHSQKKSATKLIKHEKNLS